MARKGVLLPFLSISEVFIMDLSAKLKALRERTGLSMREFANNYLGEDYANYAKLEKTGTKISGRRVYRLSQVYGVKYEDFLYKDADELTINLTSFVGTSIKSIVKIKKSITPIELLDKCKEMGITIDDMFYTEKIEKSFKYKPKKLDNERIKQLRLNIGIGIESVRKYTDVNVVVIEKGSSKEPKWHNLLTLAAFYGVTPQSFFVGNALSYTTRDTEYYTIRKFKFSSERLKALREEKKYSQLYILNSLNFQKREYDDYENGKLSPSFNRALKICKFFDVDVYYLYDIVEEQKIERPVRNISKKKVKQNKAPIERLNENETFNSKRLKELREARGLNRTELYEQLNRKIGVTSLRNYERDREYESATSPKMENIKLLADFFGVEVKEMIIQKK